MGYTTLHNMSQIGLGVSAISDFEDSYFQNPKNIHQYIEETLEGKTIPKKSITLDMEDLLRRKIIETMMCHGEISIKSFENIYNFNFKEHFFKAWGKILEFEEEGLIKLDNNSIKLTKLGMVFMRNVVMPFDRHLDKIITKKFSKTI